VLFPQQNEFRSRFNLGGFWRLKPDPDDVGLAEQWQSEPLSGDVVTVAVPGAWNEQLAERGLMNYVGACWYETDFVMPVSVSVDAQTWLYVGAADHKAEVWLNGEFMGGHEGGHLPFDLEITRALAGAGKKNRFTVRVDSRLTMDTLPQDVDPSAPPYNDPSYDRRHLFPPTRFDFFPYGGLTRAVELLTRPAAGITDIRIRAKLEGSVTIQVEADGGATIRVVVCDAEGARVAESDGSFESGTGEISLRVDEVRPWSPADPHLYTATIDLLDESGDLLDRFDETFGIREIEVRGQQLLLNGEPLFLTGFGKHEDIPLVGRGRYDVAYVKDFELMRWIGANSFRTSHYPYDEELIRLADRLGFLVIDEVPAVSLGFWSDNLDDHQQLLENHKRVITELVARDSNHPSVIAWSIVNEANLWAEKHYLSDAGAAYFDEVYRHTKSLDDTRPVLSIIMAAHSADDVALQACDLIGLNRYFGWYTEPVDLDFAAQRIEDEFRTIFERFGKPIIMTEFGVDTVEGYHATNAQMFTEEFQTAFLMKYAEVLEALPFCAGMHVWNFADFRTPQHFRRVVLNKKGVFNRSRDPKTAAFVLRDYWSELDRVHADHRPQQFGDDFLVRDLKRPVKWRYERD
jgi:beta-glucuronidase